MNINNRVWLWDLLGNRLPWRWRVALWNWVFGVEVDWTKSGTPYWSMEVRSKGGWRS